MVGRRGIELVYATKFVKNQGYIRNHTQFLSAYNEAKISVFRLYLTNYRKKTIALKQRCNTSEQTNYANILQKAVSQCSVVIRRCPSYGKTSTFILKQIFRYFLKIYTFWTPSEVIRKPTVFLWFQGDRKLINLNSLNIRILLPNEFWSFFLSIYRQDSMYFFW